jgi:dUTP pyrophosphatase
MSHILEILVLPDCPDRSSVLDYYQNIANTNYDGDSGVDLIFPEKVYFTNNSVIFCNLGIACAFYINGISSPFDLVPRSSISKTPLMLANSIGIIDRGYRGPIIAALRCFDNDSILAQSRLVQIVSPDRQPIQIKIVDQLDVTERGDRGFGSTN